jgi:hypothetical protein
MSVADNCGLYLEQEVARVSQSRYPQPLHPILFQEQGCNGTVWPLLQSSQAIVVVQGGSMDPRTRVAPYRAEDVNVVTFVARAIWCPPGYVMAIYLENPSGNGSLATRPQLLILPNNLLSTEKSVRFSNGSSWPSAANTAVYIVLWREYSFPQQLLQLCTGTTLYLGPFAGEEHKNLAFAWHPQSRNCDQFVTALCRSTATRGWLATQGKPDLCDCFDQQAVLNQLYGDRYSIPVICFGTTCGTSLTAYKTSSMVQSVKGQACSFAECQELVLTLGSSTASTTPTAPITCQNQLVQVLPPVLTTQTTLTSVPDAAQQAFTQTILTTVIPVWAWYVTGLGAALLLVTLFLLGFVSQDAMPTLGSTMDTTTPMPSPM